MKQRTLNTFFATEWAMEPNYLRWLTNLTVELCSLPTAERRTRLHAVEAERGERLEYTYNARIRNGVAILPIKGPISAEMDFFTYYSGGTSISTLARDFTACLNDARVTAILFEINTPGGAVDGLSELARMIYEARGQKPMVARVRNLCCSAGLWLAAAVGDIVIADTAQVGSLGVYTVYLDTSRADAKNGFREIVFRSSQSPKKNLDPATAAGADQLQARLDALGQIFVEAVAEYRGVTSEKVLADFGQGDVLVGQAAVEAGIADRLGTFEETLADLARHAGAAGGFNGSLVDGVVTADDAAPPALGAEATGPSASADEDEEEVPSCPDHPDGCPNGAPCAPNDDTDAEASAHAPLTTTGAESMQENTQPAAAGAQPPPTVEDLQAQLAAANERAQQATAQAAQLEAAALTRRLQDKAANFAGDKEAKVSFMQKLVASHGEDSAELTAYLTDQNALAEQIKQGALFAEQGSSQTSAQSAGEQALAQLDQLAKERSTKEGSTFAVAYAAVCNEHKELYAKATSA